MRWGLNFRTGGLEMNKKLHSEAVDQLFEAILCLKNKEECYTFFEDVCTINELLSLSQRFEVAKMLREKRTYLEISEKTGASTATISRVNRSLSYGNQRKKQNQRIHHNSCGCKKNGKEDQNSFDRLVFSCLLFFHQHFCVQITHLLHPPQDIRSVLLHCPRSLY